MVKYDKGITYLKYTDNYILCTTICAHIHIQTQTHTYTHKHTHAYTSVHTLHIVVFIFCH